MWKTVKLGDVCDFVRGPFGGSLKKNMFSESGYAVYEQQHAINNQCKDFRYFIPKQKFDEMRRFEVKSGDVLMSCSGTIGKTVIVPIEAPVGIINQALLKITPHKTIDVNYLSYFMSSRLFSNQLMSTVDGAAIQNVASVKILKEIFIFLPPLAEQQRIVAKLDAAFAEIDNIATITEKKLEEARKLYASGITEIYYSDKSVPVVPLSTISKIKGGKRLPKGKTLQIEPTSYPYIRVSDFTNFGTIDEKSVQYITEEIHSEISRYTISSEDVYVSIAGTIGKTGIIPQSLDGANLTENAAKIVLNGECDKNYFYFFTTSSSFEKQAIAQTRTAAQPKLALERLGAVELPIHKKLTQQAIAEKARDLRDSVKLVETLLNEKLLKTQALKSAILAKELQSEAA